MKRPGRGCLRVERMFPGDSVKDVMAKLQSTVGDEIQITLLNNPQSSPSSPLRDDVTQAVTQAVHAQFPNVPIIPTMVPWGTDGSVLRSAGIPTYGIAGGFIRNEDVFVHGLNEKIPVKAFYSSLEHWYVILKELATD